MFDHPRWGVIPCLASIHAIQEEEEIFVKYGYDLDFCPDWYLAAWEQGTLLKIDVFNLKNHKIPIFQEIIRCQTR